jgi:hypothetical protein
MKAGIIAKALAGLALLALVAGLLLHWNSIRIQYHIMLYHDAQRPISPQNISRQRYSMHWVRWLVEGRPDRTTQQAARWKHEQALISLGYCDRRAYSLTNATIIDLSKSFVGHQFADGGILSISAAGGMDRLVIFATKQDFPYLEEKITEVERKK